MKHVTAEAVISHYGYYLATTDTISLSHTSIIQWSNSSFAEILLFFFFFSFKRSLTKRKHDM